MTPAAKKKAITISLATPLSEAGFSKPYRDFFARKELETVSDLVAFPPRRILSFQNHESLDQYLDGKIALVLNIQAIESRPEKNFMFLHGKDMFGHTFKIITFAQKQRWERVLPSIFKSTSSVKMLVYGSLRQNLFDNSENPAQYFLEAQILELYSKKEDLTQPIYFSDRSDNSKLSKAVASMLDKAQFQDSLDALLPDYLPSFDQMLRHLHQPSMQSEYELAVHRYNIMALLNFSIRLHNTASLLTAYDETPRTIACKRIPKELPFKLNESQETAIQDVIAAVHQPASSLRYVLGEVGAGKSVIAYESAYAIIHGKASTDAPKRVVILAPTVPLATQHYNRFLQYHPDMKDQTVLATAQTKVTEITSYSVVIGTHALFKFKKIHADVVFIDEPQKFGIQQQKWGLPTRYVFLTATPLPRWMAMILSGSVAVNDLTPRDRNVTTVLLDYSESMFEKLIKTLPAERKKMVIAPKISSNIGVYPSLEDVAEFLETRQHPFVMIHGRTGEKQVIEALNAFDNNEVTTLLATQIIETGIDIPDARYIAIFAPESFGYLSLWQLIGRVGRDGSQAYAYLLTHAKDKMQVFANEVQSGYDAAKMDLVRRGTGALDDSEQSGLIKVPLSEYITPAVIKAANQIYLDLAKNHADKLAQIGVELEQFFAHYY